MKNLYRLAHQSVQFNGLDLSSNSGEGRKFMVVDSNNSNLLYVVTGTPEGTRVHRLDRSNPLNSRELLSVPVSVIAVEHLSLNDELCLATETGDVSVLNLARGEDQEPETVTFCAGGLKAMGWSPDQEVVVFVDWKLDVVTMNSAYDPIHEVCLSDDTFGDREFMSVGWGKKETQFHGSEGKSAARKNKEEAEMVIDSEKLDSSVRISWRADGMYFVVGFLSQFGRAFKVFNKEGALQFTSEKCYGLEAPMGWRPSGLGITVPQILKDKYVIALFEKNGLKHNEFVLPFSHEEETVKGIFWSNDSEVLVLQTRKHSNRANCLYFYIMCNYHWYIKQSQEFTDEIFSIQWDLKYSEGKTLHVLLDNGMYEASRWEFSVDHSSGFNESDESIVAVIDKKSVMLTNFRSITIPPPMCGFTLNVECFVNSVTFLRNPEAQLDSNCFMVVESKNRVNFYRPEFSQIATHSVNNVQSLGQPLEIGPGIYSHWLWLRNDILLTIEGSNRLIIFTVDVQSGEHSILEAIQVGTDIDRVCCIEAFNATSVVVEIMTGHLFKLTVQSPVLLEEFIELPEFCEQLRICHLDKSNYKCFSLRNRQNLYVNGTKIASDVMSMYLTEHYLLFTTIERLKFIDLHTNKIISNRRVERGSKLVTVVPKSSRTVLQLPRGNLEVITPRILSLYLIADLLNELEYQKAFTILRKERINLNLMVDHNPQLFISNLDRFLKEITNVNWLNLFISEIQNQDVCTTMYESNYQEHKPAEINGYNVDTKVEYICDKLLQAMDSQPTRVNYSLPKITCYVKKGLLNRALNIIWDLKKGHGTSEEADEALKYLLCLVNVNDLFNVALGMYDFGLVLFVATKSQKDPKEYLPFLNEMKRLDDNYGKFKIDCHLKRYDRAIEHIAKYQDDEEKFQEALALIQNHGLYGKALAVYKANQKYYQKICACFGDYLRQLNQQVDASLMYEKAGNYQQAIASARNAADWERCLKLATTAHYSEEEFQRLVHSLIPALQENGEFEAASRLAKEHLRDERLAVELLLKDHLFDKALLEAHLTDPALVEDMIRPNLQEYLQTFQHKLSDEKDQFVKQKIRLLAVREEKNRKKLNPEVDEEDCTGRDLEDCDLYSDTSTVASSIHTTSSGRSGKSHRSSKNRRKHERKLLSLKEGNAFEDIALVDALHALVVRVCSIERQRQVRALCKAAIEMDFLTEASTIQKHYSDLLHVVKYSLDAIWIPEMMVSSSGQEVEKTAFATGDLSQVQDLQHYALIKPHQRYKPELQIISWQFEVLK